MSYQKKDGRVSFFWYDNDLKKKMEKIFFFKNKKSKKLMSLPIHPSFGMTITQDIRDLFCVMQPVCCGF